MCINKIKTIAQHFAEWSTECKPHVFEMFGDSAEAFAESWIEWLDSPLANDEFLAVQHRSTPDYGKPLPPLDFRGEFAYLLDELGVVVDVEAVGSRVAGNTTFNAYRFTISRNGVSVDGEMLVFSGAEFPDAVDVLESQLLASAHIRDTDMSIEAFAAKDCNSNTGEELRDNFNYSLHALSNINKLFQHADLIDDLETYAFII